MIPYQKEKLENAVCYFAKEHASHTRHRLYQTFLYKYLALFDFGYLRAYGKPALGLTYQAMQMGPVPKELYDRRDDKDLSKCFAFQKDESGHLAVVAKTTPNLDYFSKREIELMNQIVETYAAGYVTAAIMSDASHQEIRAWQHTWKCAPNTVIDFAREFPGDVINKPEHQLTFPEEVFLVQKGLEHCS
ncbi:MAG: Panacea domain-containing protein [Syntrophales bacterium]